MKIQMPVEVFIFIFPLILLLVIFQPVNAQQQKEVNRQWQTWLGFNSTYRIHQKWDAIISLQANRTDFAKDPNFYYASAGVNYWLKDIHQI